MTFGMENLERCDYPIVKKTLTIRLFVLTESTNVTDTHTVVQTDTASRLRLRLHSVARQKLRDRTVVSYKSIPACDRRTDGRTDTPPTPMSRSGISERDKEALRKCKLRSVKDKM